MKKCAVLGDIYVMTIAASLTCTHIHTQYVHAHRHTCNVRQGYRHTATLIINIHMPTVHTWCLLTMISNYLSNVFTHCSIRLQDI